MSPTKPKTFLLWLMRKKKSQLLLWKIFIKTARNVAWDSAKDKFFSSLLEICFQTNIVMFHAILQPQRSLS